jgi:hypothetical protein
MAGNLFATLFPTEAEEMAAVAARVGAPVTAPVPGHPVATASGAGTTVAPGGEVVSPLPAITTTPRRAAASGLTYALSPTPAALATLYLASEQPGTVTWENIADPVAVPARGSITRAYPAQPLGTAGAVRVPLAPIFLPARPRTPPVSVTALAIDGVTLLTSYPLVHDASVLSQAHAVIRNQVTVTLANTSWRDVTVTVILTAAALRTSVYAAEVAPALARAAATLKGGS